jgi:hypothetical protein
MTTYEFEGAEPVIPGSILSPEVTISGFTNRSLIEALYSQLGLSNILEDLDDATILRNGKTERDLVIDQFIADTESTMFVRLGSLYSKEDMVGDTWITSRATHIAAYMISTRRGNEHYFQSLYDEAIRELDAIATGELPPLPSIPLLHDTYPSMSNYIVDERFAIEKLRVRSEISVGGTYPGQPIAIGYFWGWL